MLLLLVKLEKTVRTDPSHHPRHDDDDGGDYGGDDGGDNDDGK